MQKRAGIYIRVSTQEQAKEGFSIPAQRERLISYCKAKDWLISDVYIDPGHSGANLDRPDMQRLIADMDKLDVVVVYKLDRLSRSQRDTLHLIEEVFLPNDVDFVSINESFDTSTPFGKAMIGILSVFAQLEREQFLERSRMGKEERAKEGQWKGGPLPFGYDYIDGKLIPNEDAEKIKLAFRLCLDGKSNAYIAAAAGFSTPARASHFLSKPIFAGKIVHKGKIYDGDHEPIITWEDYEKVQQIKARKQKVHGAGSGGGNKYLLIGLLYCKHCGARYYGHRGGGTSPHYYYSCYSRGKNNKRMIVDPNCKNKHWRIEKLNARVEEELFRLAVDDKFLDGVIKAKPNNNALEAIRQRIAEIEAKIKKLINAFVDGDKIFEEEIKSKMEELYADKKELLQLLKEEEKKIIQPTPLTDALELVRKLKSAWSGLTLDEKQDVLKMLINKILLDGDKIEIEWSFI